MGLGIWYYRKINNKYRLRELIGTGTTSDVYRVRDRDGATLAVKVVSRGQRFLLAMENEVLQQQLEDDGIPSSYFFGRHGNKYVMVMDILGESLASVKQRMGTFSVKSGLVAGIRMTECLESLHKRGFVHQYICPHNFLVGLSRNDRNVLFLTNYKRVISFRQDDGDHRLPTWGLSFHGSKTFASRHAHRGERQSRRSDLESVIYVVIYLMKGLPWDNLSPNDFLNTANMKERISGEELCGGLPWELVRYFNEVRGLEYSECPKYSELCGYLRSALYRVSQTDGSDVFWAR